MYADDGYEVIESQDQTSGHAVGLFYAWRKELPGIIWIKAVADRHKGLDLYMGGSHKVLHFRTVFCGYRGIEPEATVDILVMAGFGAKHELTGIITEHKHLTFERQGPQITITNGDGVIVTAEKEGV